ncbi:MAG TPA: hypothetical protein VHU80_24720 [Polyangiaceae bacterium]|jgi:hypothetical protein|nr:hypothetical protein [Polyangiaceae bacterium]
MMSITRAEWDSAKETLRLEGECSDYSASLSAEFGGRTEPMTNDMGRFRNEFTNVASNPGTVTVTTTSGVSAASSVTVK